MPNKPLSRRYHGNSTRMRRLRAAQHAKDAAMPIVYSAEYQQLVNDTLEAVRAERSRRNVVEALREIERSVA